MYVCLVAAKDIDYIYIVQKEVACFLGSWFVFDVVPAPSALISLIKHVKVWNTPDKIRYSNFGGKWIVFAFSSDKLEINKSDSYG